MANQLTPEQLVSNFNENEMENVFIQLLLYAETNPRTAQAVHDGRNAASGYVQTDGPEDEGNGRLARGDGLMSSPEPVSYAYSCKLESTAKGLVIPTIHVYSNDMETARKQAVEQYAKIINDLKAMGLTVASLEVKA